MNYRHQFHAGNFADAMKHALLVRLVRSLQRKEKPLLCLDTHAGRGRYDLRAAAVGDSLARKPEWPDGIGRLWARPDLPADLAEYVTLVREFDHRSGNAAERVGVSSLRENETPARPTAMTSPQFYPGSPWLLRLLARAQDRLALCERHPAECAALRDELAAERRVSVHEMDGYIALRAMLPPPERRALVLLDPPFEAPDEFAQIATGLREALDRFPSGVFALWYPLTERARVDEFFHALLALNPPPTLTAELAIAGEHAAIKLRGCGLVVVNPPWQFEREAAPLLEFLAVALAQAPGGGARVEWLVPEK